ncbi:MAG TPA: hypothetical protein VFW77_01540 [Candidatus Saccharimonadales bacterium]|nr:hypothetical protein [Candidatus Saccharimonadales bacterium]
MQDFIVLGQIPGTNWHFGFLSLLYLLEFVLVIYIIKSYHLKKLKGIEKRLRTLKWSAKKFMKRPHRTIKSYKKKLSKKLLHFRNDVLGPKLKFLK